MKELKLLECQLELIFEKNPEIRELIHYTMPKGCDAYLVFREKGNKQRPVLSYREEF